MKRDIKTFTKHTGFDEWKEIKVIIIDTNKDRFMELLLLHFYKILALGLIFQVVAFVMCSTI